MEIKKTDAQATEFADGLADSGDAALFRDLWDRKEFTLIRGHFPAFVSDEAPANTEAPANAAATKSSKK